MKEYELNFTDDMMEHFLNSINTYQTDNNICYLEDFTDNIKFVKFNGNSDMFHICLFNTSLGFWSKRIGILSVEDKSLYVNGNAKEVKDMFDKLFFNIYLRDNLNSNLQINNNNKKRIKI